MTPSRQARKPRYQRGLVLGRGQEVALDVARGIAYLHLHNVVHLDIKVGTLPRQCSLALSC